MTDPVISVLVVTYNSADHIDACVAAIRTALDGLHGEILVHDNASTDATPERLAGLPGIHFTIGERNAGFAKACNELGRKSHGDHLLFLNPDTRIDRNAIRALLAAAGEHPEAGLYGARTVTPTGQILAGSAQADMTLWSLTSFALGLSTALSHYRWANPEAMPGWDRSDSRHVPMLSGGALMLTRQAWDRLGGFDETFFMYAEDADLCARATATGYAPLFVSAALVEHASGASSSSGQKLILLHRGKVTFLRKHWLPKHAALGVYLLLVGVGLRAGLSRLARSPASDSMTPAWRTAWRQRATWRNGWAGITEA